MSLIITSNVNLKDRPVMSDIHKAYSYSNRLKDTIKIEKDSEIAVQSVKINKNGLYSLNRFNSKFGLYFGRPLSALVSRIQTGSQAVMGEVVQTSSFEEANTDDLAVLLTQAMANQICHPHYLTQVSNTYDPPNASIQVTPFLGAGGEFQGYNYVFTQNAAISNVLPNFEGDATGFLENDTNGDKRWTYDPGTNRFTSTNPDNQANYGGAGVWLNDYPLALNTRDPATALSFTCDFSNCNSQSGFCIGMGRHNDLIYNETDGSWEAYAPPYFDNFYNGSVHFGARDRAWSHPNQHYDYVVCRIGNSLRVFHSVIKSNREPIDHGSPWNVVMKEIRYWEVAGSPLAGAGAYDLSTNLSNYSQIGWSIDNTAVEPWIYTATKGGWFKIVDITLAATTKLYCPKLRGTINNVLYGKMWVRNNGEYLTVVERRKPDAMDDWVAGNPRSDYVRHLIDNGTYDSWGRELETRPIYDYDISTHVTKPTFTRSDAATGVLTNMNPVLVTTPSDPYGLEMTQGANAQFIMGFKGRSIQDAPVVSGASNEITTFTSTEVPKIISPKSLFIKLSNFTHQTANGQQGQTSSKLLAHLPRFDNAGNETGGLYFEPHERVYVSLGNAQDLFLNTFDVEVVYDNEEVAKCISGKTIVCFHIRRKLFSELKD